MNKIIKILIVIIIFIIYIILDLFLNKKEGLQNFGSGSESDEELDRGSVPYQNMHTYLKTEPDTIPNYINATDYTDISNLLIKTNRPYSYIDFSGNYTDDEIYQDFAYFNNVTSIITGNEYVPTNES